MLRMSRYFVATTCVATAEEINVELSQQASVSLVPRPYPVF